MQDDLRKEVKVLKALSDVTYKDLAERLGIHPNSFYNWIKDQYSLSAEREKQLIEIIKSIKENKNL